MSTITLALLNTKTRRPTEHQLEIDLTAHDADTYHETTEEWRESIIEAYDAALDAIHEAMDNDDVEAENAARKAHKRLKDVDFETLAVITYDDDEHDTVQRYIKTRSDIIRDGDVSRYVGHDHFDFEGYFDHVQARDNTHIDADAFEAGVYLGIPLDEIADQYDGHYPSDADYAEAQHDGLGTDLGPLAAHIDWDSVAHDMQQGGDFCEHNGYYFRNW